MVGIPTYRIVLHAVATKMLVAGRKGTAVPISRKILRIPFSNPFYPLGKLWQVTCSEINEVGSSAHRLNCAIGALLDRHRVGT